MSDLISREAAIDELRKMYRAAEEWGKETNNDEVKIRAESCMAGIIEMELRVEKLPTAEKVGKWKYETMRHIMTGEMRTVRICSECGGGWFRYDLSDGVEAAEPNYCPNCGADMRGEEQDG